MTNLEKYNLSFTEALMADEGDLDQLAYQSIPAWDSVGHMTLVSSLEEAFDIMFEMDDILDFSSYEKGRDILLKYQVAL